MGLSFRISGFGFRVLDVGIRDSGIGIRESECVFRDLVSMSRIWSLGFRDAGFRVLVSGVGYIVSFSSGVIVMGKGARGCARGRICVCVCMCV